MRQRELTDGAKSAGENRVAGDDSRRGNVSLQTDPKVEESWNSYDYANSSPIAISDPEGLLAIGGGSGAGGGTEGGACWECKSLRWPLCGTWCVAASGGETSNCQTVPDPRAGRGHCLACMWPMGKKPCGGEPIGIWGDVLLPAMGSTQAPDLGVVGDIAKAMEGPEKDDYVPKSPRVQCHSGFQIDSAQSEPALLSR